MATASAINAHAGSSSIVQNAYDKLLEGIDLKQASKSLTSAQERLRKAVESGDPAATLQADADVKSKTEIFTALSQLMKSMHELMMSIIRNIG